MSYPARPTDDSRLSHRPRVIVNTSAITRNYTRLCTDNRGITISCVIKADAYGLGAEQVGQALYAAGCRHFFVAYPFEGALLRAVVGDAEIFVFHGPSRRSMPEFDTHRLTPVLNTVPQIDLWRETLNGPAALHLDTGLNRLGLPEADTADTGLFEGLRITTLISHLSHGGERDEGRNAAQYNRLERLLAKFTPLFPEASVSFKGSAGIFSSLRTREHIYRAGVSLYGGNPFGNRSSGNRSSGASSSEAETSALECAATLYAPILQVQTIKPGQSVGYNGTFIANRPCRIATLGIGYADGLKRLADERRMVVIKGTPCPIIGTVSMDLTTIDISACQEDVAEGDHAEIFGPAMPLDAAAHHGNTIGYELLATMGPRIERIYMQSAFTEK